ncbi:MAG: thymidine kinase [Myxococcales bacterium]|nr:thymidine kinase [Myxococcales bacterium]
MQVVQAGVGWVEVISGPMFSGKTEELVRRLRRAQIARQSVQVFKPRIDDRYDATAIVSHSATSMQATVVDNVDQMARLIDQDSKVVGIDEVQFLDRTVVDLVQRLADHGVRVICAGLDQDYTGKPFDPMPELLAVAEYITKTLAICTRCGAPASRSQRLVSAGERVVVGAAESYEARCRRCHVPRAEPTTGELFRDEH